MTQETMMKVKLIAFVIHLIAMKIVSSNYGKMGPPKRKGGVR